MYACNDNGDPEYPGNQPYRQTPYTPPMGPACPSYMTYLENDGTKVIRFNTDRPGVANPLQVDMLNEYNYCMAWWTEIDAAGTIFEWNGQYNWNGTDYWTYIRIRFDGVEWIHEVIVAQDFSFPAAGEPLYVKKSVLGGLPVPADGNCYMIGIVGENVNVPGVSGAPNRAFSMAVFINGVQTGNANILQGFDGMTEWRPGDPRGSYVWLGGTEKGTNSTAGFIGQLMMGGYPTPTLNRVLQQQDFVALYNSGAGLTNLQLATTLRPSDGLPFTDKMYGLYDFSITAAAPKYYNISPIGSPLDYIEIVDPEVTGPEDTLTDITP